MCGDRFRAPIRASAGIAEDIGHLTFESSQPSPSNASLSGFRRALFPRAAAQRDPWLARGQKPDCFAPPSMNTYARFKVKLDAFVRRSAKNPDELQREIHHRRVRMRTHALVLSDPLPVCKVPLKGSKRATGVPVASGPDPQLKPPRRPKVKPPPILASDILEEAFVPGAGAGDAVGGESGRSPALPNPISPSAVPIEGDSPAGARIRALRPDLKDPLPSSRGLPHCQPETLPFSPPHRKGWVPFEDGRWQMHPDASSWLHKPNEGMYFHMPSNTLWNEAGEEAEDMTRQLSKVRIAPALVQEADLLPEAAFTTTPASGLDQPSSAGGAAAPLAEPPECPGPLPFRGWRAVNADMSWESHPKCAGWLHEPAEHLFFHLDSETLWCIDSDGEETWEEVPIRLVVTGNKGLPGTPASEHGRPEGIRPRHLTWG